MKRLLSILVLSSIFFVSCSSDGEPGPPGPQGPPGPAGDIIGQAFEVNVDFLDSAEYSVFAEIPSTIEVLETDIVLVYWLEFQDDGNDVWNPVPQTIYFEDGGEFQYNYNHTDFDVNIYLQGNIDLDTLGERYTEDQVFKIVVLPVDYAENNNVDVSDYQQLKSRLNIKEFNVNK